MLALLAVTTTLQAQEDDPILPYRVAPQNLLKFNRFLINPTFSTVREDKSYINLLHRNQSVQFQDNDQTYFLSYSGRIGDRSGLGLSLYNQSLGPISNIGVLANYAYGIKLSDKSNFTFGGNLAYYSSGLNLNEVTATDQFDNRLVGTEDSNVLSFQPGFNISYGQFDFGAYAENLIEYNLKTSASLSEFGDKAYSAHLQYTYPFDNSTGILENARLLPLARVRMNGQRALSTGASDLTLGGSLILDLPRLGWVQAGYDDFYGASAGAGFNINRRVSIGYNMEKGLVNNLDNFGVTHEISFAYSFTPNLSEDRVMLEDDNDLAEDDEPEDTDLASNEEIEELKRKLAENDAIIAELMFRQDSLESNRQKDLERRFEMVMHMVRNETDGERPDLEKRAESLFRNGDDAVAANTGTTFDDDNVTTQQRDVIPNTGIGKEDDYTDAVTQNDPNTGKYTNSSDATDNNYTSTTDNDAYAANSGNYQTAQDNTQAQDYNTAASRESIKSRKFKNLEGVQDGYYVVANVYKGGHYMDKFMNDLNEQGFVTDYIDNPDNGLKYVYLERHDSWEDAAEAYKSSLGGSYDGDLWIMNVDNRYTNDRYASNVEKVKEKSDQYNTGEVVYNQVQKDRVGDVQPVTRETIINGVGSGYYIIANVFASPKNANRFVKLLNSYGLSASYFVNPENNWRYVYLKRHESWNNALISYYSKLNDSYEEKMWIMRVKAEMIT